MTGNRNHLLTKLEQLGEENVRSAIALGKYVGKQLTAAQQWLDKSEHKRERTFKVENKKAMTVNRGTFRAFRWIPSSLCRTMTFDNGKEFSAFKELEKKFQLAVYFAHPYASWERGTNENTNGLLREFFPKKTDFRQISHQRVVAVVSKLNNRPRKCLGYRTPREVLFDD